MSKKSAAPFNLSSQRPVAAVLIGPTASGKTEVLRELSRRLPIEVISCDSMQVYRDIRILSQAPSAAVLREVPHHEIGVVSAGHEYDAAYFARRARELVPQIIRRGRLPVIAGGTGLYLKALLDGLLDGPGAQPEIRQRLESRAEKEGSRTLHQELVSADPKAASKIHPHDARRIVRALEVIEVTGQKFSDVKERRNGVWGEWEVRVWGLEWDRAVLYSRIDARVLAMFKAGARAEVLRLNPQKLSKTAAGCLGLKEMRAWASGEILRDAAISSIQMNTRRYAKRQLTWFRHESRIHWIPRSPDRPAKEAAAFLSDQILAWLSSHTLLAQTSK